MMQDNKSETRQDVQETGQTVHHHQQQPSLKHTGSGSPHSQNEPCFDDYTTSTKPTRTQVARETIETYKNYRNKRKTKDLNWWGSKHHEAERGDPDREFEFARNMPVSNQDIKSAQQAYNSRVTDPFTGKPNPLGPHLRPTTPPMERAEKQIKGLENQGINVTPGLREEVTHHFISNSGLHAALLIWCRNKKDVPVQYVNEYIKSMSRLKLEMATQQRGVTEKLGQAIKDCEEREFRCQQLQAENSRLNMEIERLKEEEEKTGIQANPLVTTQDARQLALGPDMTAVGKAEEEKAHLEDSSIKYNKNSIPPPATVQLHGNPLASVREASESSQSSQLSPVTTESLEKKVSEAESERDTFLDQLPSEQDTTGKLSSKIKELEEKPWSMKAEKSNATRDDAYRNRVQELEFQLQNLKEVVQLADSILQATKYDEEQNSLSIKGLPLNPFRRKNKRQYTKIRGTIKDDPAMKAEALRLTGVHSPLSPHKWRKEN
ncbi:uncharacterized protein LW93_11777 [Fusarium fujikuroi]|nr:uncharacterized protein LW93_11777 [Fusarium fujikuroi]